MHVACMVSQSAAAAAAESMHKTAYTHSAIGLHNACT